MTTQVSFPLTLVMNLKSATDAQAVAALLKKFAEAPEGQNPIDDALTKIGTVHFARFVFLSELQVAVITSYDGPFETYIKAFTAVLGEIFDELLSHMSDAPPLPVKDNLPEFLAYITANDRSEIDGVRQPLYSAYPELSVFTILNLAKQSS
jgi:hypothetical protein